jgi:hypothetical protein
VPAGQADTDRARIRIRVIAQDDRDRVAIVVLGVRDDMGSRVLLDYGHQTAPYAA